MDLPINQIVQSDNVSALRNFPDSSIDLVVTSPPYDGLRDYQDLAWNFESLAQELFRVLAKGGICCWVIGDSVVDGSETVTSAKQKIFFHDVCGFRIHDTMIYRKRNFTNPAKNRYHQTFEYIFVLSKGRPKCFNPLKDKPNICAGKPGTVGRNTVRLCNGEMLLKQHYRRPNTEFGMRHNVWEGNSRGQEEMGKSLSHPAMMPKWLARDLIISWSSPRDIVLDPFNGSGTTCIQAKLLDRRYIGMDSVASYCAQAIADLRQIVRKRSR